jgi:hypothetical protein
MSPSLSTVRLVDLVSRLFDSMLTGKKASHLGTEPEVARFLGGRRCEGSLGTKGEAEFLDRMNISAQAGAKIRQL